MTYVLDLLEVDSDVFNLRSWNLTCIESPEDFQLAIESVSKNQLRNYITCKLPIENIGLIHAAEKSGFNFVETQFKTTIRLKSVFDTSRYPYTYVPIETHDQLQEVLTIAETTIEHDRFSRDPRIGRDASGLRYRRYLEDSFYRQEDQIWAVKSKSNGQLLTFRSYRVLETSKVELLLGGVHQEFKNSGLGIVSTHFCFNQLHDAGFYQANTHISAANIPILNLEVGYFDFRISKAFVVLSAYLE